MDDTRTNEEEISHKGKKICSYPVKMKIEAVNYAEIMVTERLGENMELTRKEPESGEKTRRRLQLWIFWKIAKRESD